MRVFNLITFIAPLCASAIAAKKVLPGYKHLYSWSLEISEITANTIQGPLGTRIGVAILGGNMTSPKGQLIAKAVPGLGGDTGIIDKDGTVLIDARVYYQFIDDKKYAYVVSGGVGSIGGAPIDSIRIETDSPSRSAWNSYFIVGNVSVGATGFLQGDAFTFSG
ncbi:hypothetical protein RhiJN_06382 [Ceratobasidium sp. AG-Ba]|nr:hypothetical protein RhiJN_06382 [Ceratobasidium sp. AG-Ba]QRW07295.1 hypothetical protein RhiLY_06294 [Ceratobasidium sp. AG-Ba]